VTGSPVNAAEAAPWVLVGILFLFTLLVLAIARLARHDDDKDDTP
jgi:hypothetical protein